METYSANDAKQNLGTVIDKALREPVSITKHGRPVVVVTSDADYSGLLQLKYEKLKADVRAGFESLERGDSTLLENEKALHDFMEEVKRRGRERLAREQG